MPKICHGQPNPQLCAHSALDFIQIGSHSVELLIVERMKAIVLPRRVFP